MKVALLTALRTLEIADWREPELKGADEVLLQMDRVGVCGSDVHYYTRGRIGNQVIDYPATVGHECSATVVQVGTAVDRLKPGDRVAIDPAISCGTCDQCRAGRVHTCRTCDQCRAGRVHTCRNLQFMGCPRQAPGAAAEYRLMPAGNCLKLPEAVSLDEAVLAEPLSIGLHAVRLGEVYPAARIAILGAGPIGLSVLLCAKATAPAVVYATDLIDERLEVARLCGADWTGNPRQHDVVGTILEQEPVGVNLVFECSGDPACARQALDLLASGGSLVLVGIPPLPEWSFDADTMRHKEVTIKNVRRQNGCVGPVLRLMAGGQIDARPLLTHHFPLERISDAFELVADYREGVVKALIDLSSTG